MPEEPEENSPPQSILIQAGSSTLEAEQSPDTEHVLGVEEGSVKVKTAPNQSSRKVSYETIEAYEIVLRNKPDTNMLGVLTIIFLFVIPGMMFFSTGFDILFESEANSCCGSILLGLVFGLGILVTESEWDRKRKKAEKRVIEEAGITHPPVSSGPKIAAVISFIVGFIFSDLDDAFFVCGGLLSMIFLGLAAQMQHNAQKAVEEQVKLIIAK